MKQKFIFIYYINEIFLLNLYNSKNVLSQSRQETIVRKQKKKNSFTARPRERRDQKSRSSLIIEILANS